ncbi:MAG: DUF1707 SHOCT-like domain-containing protein [Haloechinothrix sp.]
MTELSDPRIRASDGDRERVVAELARQVAAGRLTLDEFSDRARVTYQAHTLGELSALTADLPPERATQRRRIPAAVVVAAAVLSFLLGGAALATGTGAVEAKTVAEMPCH